MSARATRSACRLRGRGVRRLAAAVAGGIALTASAQSYYIPDLRPPPPRVATAPRAGEACEACGRIVSIREVNINRAIHIPPSPGAGPPDPGNPTQQNLVGAVIFLPFGDQRVDKPYVGPVGTPEMNARMRETTYEVTVRLDDGSYRQVRRADASAFGVGDRVRWLGGEELELLVN